MKSVRLEVRIYLATALLVTLVAFWNDKAAGAVTAAPPTNGGDDAMVLQWNAIAVQVVDATLPLPTPPFQPLRTATAPFPSTRAMAIVQLAVFEAVNAITRRYGPYLGLITAPEGASADAAVIAATHDALVWLFPDPNTVTALSDKQAASLAVIPDGQAKDDGVKVGQAAAAAMILNRTNDGSQPPMFYTPTSSAPYEWQPTPSCAIGPANNRGLFFHWQFVKPFGVESASQFRAEPPPEISGGKYAKDLNEVASVGSFDSTLRTAYQANVAKFYAAQPPHRGWNLIARELASVRADEITRTARTFAMLNMSLADAHITVFETKYFYRGWRAETAIHRADEDNNDKTAADPSWRPYIVTPCFPGFASAHGIGAGAARTILWRAYGRKHHDITLTEDSLPNIVLHYTDLMDVTDDVATARIYGGIHFRVDQDVGDRMGVDIASYDDDHWLLRLTLGDGDGDGSR